MSDRLGVFPTFANQSPPWSLPTLDAGFIAIRTFANDSSLGFVNAIATDTGSTNNYVVTCPFGSPTSYNEGMTIAFIPAHSNTGSSTIQVLPLAGTISILDSTGAALATGALVAGQLAFGTVVSGALRLIGVGGGGLFYTTRTILIGGTTTVACSTASQISIVFNFAGAPLSTTYTITLTGVTLGAQVDLQFLMAGSSQRIRFASCTDSSGNAITDITSMDTGGNLTYDWTTSINPTSRNGGSAFLYGNCFRAATTSYLRFVYGWQ